MITAVLAGLAVALGVLGLAGTARRRRPRLAEVLAAVEREPGWSAAGGREAEPRVAGRRLLRPDRAAGSALASLVRGSRLGRRLEGDLFVTERTLDGLCAESVLAGGAGLALPALTWTVMAFGGVHQPMGMPARCAGVLGVGGTLLPLLSLSSEAGRARVADRRALGSLLDLVVLGLASGMGLEGALDSAAEIGEQRLIRRLRRVLAATRGAGQPPWVALDELGQAGGLEELRELAAALSLAGREGARVRATLAAKAASMRRRELAAAEAAANRATERLFLPGILLLLGFLVFIGYPAMARIAVGL